MKHADVWYEVAEQNIPLALILEDDAIFVPYFKEKISRLIYTSIRTGALKINSSCTQPRENMSGIEWINQDSMIFIGSCFNMRDNDFNKKSKRASPLLSTHKYNPTRCTHAYLLTSCSAKALVREIHVRKNDFRPSDFMLNNLVSSSSTLQSFWIDPALAYQGNQVVDLEQLDTFKRQTYRK